MNLKIHERRKFRKKSPYLKTVPQEEKEEKRNITDFSCPRLGYVIAAITELCVPVERSVFNTISRSCHW